MWKKSEGRGRRRGARAPRSRAARGKGAGCGARGGEEAAAADRCAPRREPGRGGEQPRGRGAQGGGKRKKRSDAQLCLAIKTENKKKKLPR